ncbi:nitrite reductase (NAD(P)H) small subunit [Motiliproteus coralliicola]|uniref:Nitrite reductase (NAD(P)H) small subunit n=1 Tax=Motiliproteus coralliicola TaxID=2283196 RepID=A0A369WBU4_9GAMM|nr:nitrite reductase small subunit NirD [Motiliproteus coralliicola]RDE18096.1 nitrite reductase (NAD(P)H) small subunit [Motiliproteus coralliicola]
MSNPTELEWLSLCDKDDLIPGSGIAAWLDGEQIALFYLPGIGNEVFALSNHDPIANANVIARGITGSLEQQPVVASPLYKQHYRLDDGSCLEQPELTLKCWPVRLSGNRVEIGSDSPQVNAA